MVAPFCSLHTGALSRLPVSGVELLLLGVILVLFTLSCTKSNVAALFSAQLNAAHAVDLSLYNETS